MTSAIDHDARKRLAELGRRIDAAVDEYHEQGALHGAEREAAAELKLRHAGLTESAQSGEMHISELDRDIAILNLTFERWLARIDRQSEARS